MDISLSIFTFYIFFSILENETIRDLLAIQMSNAHLCDTVDVNHVFIPYDNEDGVQESVPRSL